MGMIDLDEIVEGFRLNIDRISPERLTEVFQMIGEELNKRIPSDTVPRARLNEILDKIAKEVDNLEAESFKHGARYAIAAIRQEIQKIV